MFMAATMRSCLAATEAFTCNNKTNGLYIPLACNIFTVVTDWQRAAFDTSCRSDKSIFALSWNFDYWLLTNTTQHAIFDLNQFISSTLIRGGKWQRWDSALNSRKSLIIVAGFGCIWKPWMSSLKWGMVACSPPRNDLVPSQNVEVTWLRPELPPKPQNSTKFEVALNVL